jgi:exodeoxyribonuclease VII large subunit
MNTPPLFDRTVTEKPVGWSVTETVAFINDLLATHSPSRVEITGVISSWRYQKGWASGELCANTNGTVEARIAFSIAKSGLPNLGQPLGNDSVVAIIGTLETRPPWQLVRLQGQSLTLIAGTSNAGLTREKLLETMRADGRLDAQKRLPMITAPITIGLITAAGSAARADIIATFTNTRIAVRVIEHNVTLTGPGAPQLVADAITRILASGPDVIIVARGGGATAELATFDDQLVADAIASSPVPIIAAIGHATDKTVADHVAHTTVVTPTAAANLVAAGHQRVKQANIDTANAQRLAETTAREEAARLATARATQQRRHAVVALIVVVTAFVLFMIMTVLR